MPDLQQMRTLEWNEVLTLLLHLRAWAQSHSPLPAVGGEWLQLSFPKRKQQGKMNTKIDEVSVPKGQTGTSSHYPGGGGKKSIGGNQMEKMAK